MSSSVDFTGESIIDAKDIVLTTSFASQLENSTLSPWLLRHCIILSQLAYERDPLHKLVSYDGMTVGHSITNASESDSVIYEGKYLVATGIDPTKNEEYHFICFRGTDNIKDIEADANVGVKQTHLGVLHSGFLERSHSVPLASILEALQKKKHVVVTGHSLGGACATLLVARFYREYGHLSFGDLTVSTITFGSPLVAGPSLGEYMLPRLQYFHHFIQGEDVVPRALTLLNDVLPMVVILAAKVYNFCQGDNVLSTTIEEKFNFKPFGNYYYINPSEANAPVTIMNNEQIFAYFNCKHNINLRDEKLICDHSMLKYAHFVNAAVGLLDIFNIDMFKTPKVNLLPVSKPPKVISCLLTGSLLVCTGEDMMYAAYLECLGYQIPISTDHTCSSDRAVFEIMDKSLLARLKGLALDRQRLQIGIIPLLRGFNQPKTVVLSDVMFAVDSMDDFSTPDKVLASVLPLVTLLVRKDSSEQMNVKTVTLFDKMFQHCQGLANALPIEFAFRSLERDSRDSEGIVFHTCINRLAAVEVPWEDLSSDVMISIVKNSIKLLRTGNLTETEIAERYKRLKDAFVKDKKSVHEIKLMVGLKYIEHTSFPEKLLIGSNNFFDSFWSFVCQQEVSLSIDLYPVDGSELLTNRILNVLLKDPTVKLPIPGGYFVSVYSQQDFLPTDLMATIVKIENQTNYLQRFLVHLACPWNKTISTAADLPDIVQMKQLLHCFSHYASLSELKRGVTLDNTRVYLHSYPTAGNKHAAFFLYAYALMRGRQTRINEKMVFPELVQQFGTDDSLLSPTQRDLAASLSTEMTKEFSITRALPQEFVGQSEVVIEAENILRSLLRKMQTNMNQAIRAQMVCGYSVMMPMHDRVTDQAVIGLHMSNSGVLSLTGSDDDHSPIASDKLALSKCSFSTNSDKRTYSPFFELFPALLSEEELKIETIQDKRVLINRAYDVTTKAKYLSIMLEDAMAFSNNVFETEREENNFAAAMKSVLKFPALIGYGAAKAAAALITQDFSHIVEVQRGFEDNYHSIFYQQMKLSSYPEVVDMLFNMLQLKVFDCITHRDKERYITDLLPPQVGTHSLDELLRDQNLIFRDSKFERLLKGRTAGLVLFFLKTIFHCKELRALRRSITFATISGQQNAGKTTLVRKIFGKQIVKAIPGEESEHTTMFPSAYFHPTKPDLVYCDLPGCTDRDTAEMSDIFLTLGDITVFLLQNGCSKRPRKNDPLCDMMARVIRMKGPRLICINGADKLIKTTSSNNPDEESGLFGDSDDGDKAENSAQDQPQSFEDYRSMLRRQCDDWTSEDNLFQISPDVNRFPQWECEKKFPAAIVASVRTPQTTMSIWLTAFDPVLNKDLVKQLLFGFKEVHDWINEVKTLTDLNSLN